MTTKSLSKRPTRKKDCVQIICKSPELCHMISNCDAWLLAKEKHVSNV